MPVIRWTSVLHDANATPIRREFADLIQRVDKIKDRGNQFC